MPHQVFQETADNFIGTSAHRASVLVRNAYLSTLLYELDQQCSQSGAVSPSQAASQSESEVALFGEGVTMLFTVDFLSPTEEAFLFHLTVYSSFS